MYSFRSNLEIPGTVPLFTTGLGRVGLLGGGGRGKGPPTNARYLPVGLLT